ncbi:TIGR00730 family Rossman fold protein [Candidatus Kaiserbacteria bacterium CG10_big_fil_rev_8_21_14_0_10_49_17]|uniref:Cytokinin riboside 5'-monophosphate phosphoribohydrolase n=1 Tax=Candidatus Kaiserbacteria bacterium CG10_big_fil_rev_8_21_14_0_10_49_17 TaxID=1974609 RepID=A0A2M6WFE2_9BACT|nr:MAG: TIGR00730 family Rossman fold protein [Candidatus Kaiserbacteria bacterium CG10_big_fil_rev_8_21_14_0_10_49_17]
MDKEQPQIPNTCRVERELFEGDAAQEERVKRICDEIDGGFTALRKYDLAATFFGSARCGAGDETYRAAEELAGNLARAGFTIITGGGPGIMAAANKGAKDAGGQSVGFNIELPEEQGLNHNTTDSYEFHYFFARKLMLTYASEVYVYFPGGFGTLDEFFEIATLVQTGRIESIPIILYGGEYWEPLLSWMHETLLDTYSTISPEDTAIFTLVDSAQEAYDAVMQLVPRCKSNT